VRLSVRGGEQTSPPAVERLARRVVHPLVGLDTRVGFVLRGRGEPRFAVAGGQLSAVHQLLGQDEAGAYHIGGVGLTRHEALVRTLGESVERYCQLVAVATGTVGVRVAHRAELLAEGRPFVDPCGLSLFTAAQLERPGFRFDPPDPDAPYGWVEMQHVPDGDTVLVPAQLAVVGYTPHRGRGEPWLAPAVTTGTATHATRTAARRGALLELIQIDTAMGHWYGPATAPRILPGARLAALGRLLRRHIGPHVDVTLHALRSPDLPAHTIACLLRQPGGRRPVAAVGLGCELRLAEAAYKAVLEAVGVLQLAKIAMAEGAVAGERVGVVDDESAIWDLDSNVAHYADGGGADVLAAKFPVDETVEEDELPPDVTGPSDDVVASLFEHLLDRGIALYERDFTTVDVADLGLVTHRVWTPDLLPLAMPSAPMLAHPRYEAHGGGVSERPHPYP